MVGQEHVGNGPVDDGIDITRQMRQRTETVTGDTAILASLPLMSGQLVLSIDLLGGLHRTYQRKIEMTCDS
jgi:hypothetical protein